MSHIVGRQALGTIAATVVVRAMLQHYPRHQYISPVLWDAGTHRMDDKKIKLKFSIESKMYCRLQTCPDDCQKVFSISAHSKWSPLHGRHSVCSATSQITHCFGCMQRAKFSRYQDIKSSGRQKCVRARGRERSQSANSQELRVFFGADENWEEPLNRSQINVPECMPQLWQFD